MKIDARFDITGIARILFATVAVLLLSGCMQLRTTSPAEPASREYKLLLDPALFDRSRITANINKLDRLAADAAHRTGVVYAGGLQEPVRTRQVTFLDVQGECILRQKGLVLRLRSKGKKTTATLKYRTPNRAAITGTDNPLHRDTAESALEVDLKPPHESIYSLSMSAKTEPAKLQTLSDIHELFPSLRVLHENSDNMLSTVGNPVHEEVRGRVSLDLGSKSGMSLSLWYRTQGDARPVIAELSFKYATGKDNAADEERARELFAELQALEGWLSPLAMTKTAFIYATSPGFCEQP